MAGQVAEDFEAPVLPQVIRVAHRNENLGNVAGGPVTQSIDKLRGQAQDVLGVPNGVDRVRVKCESGVAARERPVEQVGQLLQLRDRVHSGCFRACEDNVGERQRHGVSFAYGWIAEAVEYAFPY